MARSDIHIQLVLPAFTTSGKFYSFGFKQSLKVSGIQKLVNLFAKYLLTPVGSDPLDRSYGTNFTSLLGSNVSAGDAQDILVLAVDKTAKGLQALQPDTTPDSERLSIATVREFLLLPDVNGFAAQIYIQNVANKGLTFLIPTLQVKR